MRVTYIFGAVAAMLSVITTVGIHSFITGPASFDESLQVYTSGYYIFSKWWVIFHCLFVIAAVYSLTIRLRQEKLPFSDLGFLFYAAFGITEILRMLMVLFYMKALRDQYVTAAENLRPTVQLSLDAATGIGNMLFAAFSIFIILGNFFTGLSCMASKNRFVHWLGYGLLCWFAALLVSFVNFAFLDIDAISDFVGYFNLTYQPVVRFAMGLVLLKFALGAKTSHSLFHQGV